MLKKILFIANTIFLILVVQVTRAEVIQFPDDELSKESVLPVFDKQVAVKNRNVSLENKIELGLFWGFFMTEPIFNQHRLGLNAGYHWSEESAFRLHFTSSLGGLNTQYTNDLKNQSLDFANAPAPKYSLFGHYEWKIFYGKISLTKQGVMNILMYPFFGAGTTAYEGKNCFGVDGGMGMQFFFSPNWALRTEIRQMYSQYVSPFITGLNSNPPPKTDQFETKFGWFTALDVGVSFLF